MTKVQKNKLYQALVERGLSDSESKAKSLIMAGQVIVNDQRVDKSGFLVSADDLIRVRGEEPYVSRGGVKLAFAIQDFALKSALAEAVCLDVGASTGGFTDCLLQHGAAKVYALDVGTNQLAWKLRQDQRVESLEQTDIRKIQAPIADDISFVVADISFNSLENLLTSILGAVPAAGVQFLLLIKPQFELDSSQVPKGGVVEQETLRQGAVNKVTQSLAELGIHNYQVKDCRLPGRMGNREIFIAFQR